jgi:hypothetical protein
MARWMTADPIWEGRRVLSQTSHEGGAARVSASEFEMISMDGKPTSGTEREQTIERARSASPLDAAYIVLDFKKMRGQSPILLEDIISGLQQEEIEFLKRRANALSADEGYFGEKHWTGRPHEQIYMEMRERHPGFGRDTYELALRRGIISMR